MFEFRRSGDENKNDNNGLRLCVASNATFIKRVSSYDEKEMTVKYGFVDASFTKAHQYEQWFFVPRTREDDGSAGAVWICQDDAAIVFDIGKVYKQFGDWVVTDYGVEHYVSSAKVAYQDVHNHGLDIWAKDFIQAVRYARHISRMALFDT